VTGVQTCALPIWWRGACASLDVLAVADAAGLALVPDEAPPQGAVIEVRVDGTVVAVRSVRVNEPLQLAVAVGRGAHLLEVTTVAGGRVVPGEVILAP
jgi:hypothetical protein